ncbi:MAG: ABC transporter ATP-binding protein [Lachnospiraceae bacterium]
MSKSNSEKAGISYLFSLAKKNKSSIILAVFISILSGLCTFVPYVMVFRTILFLFSGNGNMQTVLQYGLWALLAIVLRFLFQAISMALTHVGAYNILYGVRKSLCKHLGEINLGFFTNNSIGEVKKVLMEDVERLEQFLAHQIPDVVVAIIVPLSVFIYLLSVNTWMALILLLPILLTVLCQMLMLPLSKTRMDRFYSAAGKQSAVIMQFINGMPVMKTYNLTADSYQEYAAAVEEYERSWNSAAKMLSPISAAASVLIESGLVFTLIPGGYLYLNGSLSLSSYLFFVVMSIVFLSSFSNLINFAQIFSQISAGISRIKAIMDIPAAIRGTKNLETSGTYDITFNNVSFAYEQREVLHDVSMQVPQGSLTAFVGASGAGKSTAAQLISRFWDAQKGSISISGTDIKEIKMENLMDSISFVFQDAFMLEDTLYENIAVGKTGCSRVEVEEAAKAAQIHSFITGLPQGYDTQMGSAGVKMSGGERQRICIARAILKNSPIIVFDEATSFTDIENEHKIQLALSHLLKGKTTIMIAHRLHTIISADKICVFDQGRLIEQGTHLQLLQADNYYKKMWDTYTRANREAETYA